MLVLLQANVPNLGHIGDLVKVKPGYARNFLFPKQLALFADDRNKKQVEHANRLATFKKAKAVADAKETAVQIANVSLTIQKAVGEDDRIFGTVTTLELVEAFKLEGYTFDRKMISVIEDIKKVGVYNGVLKLHPEVSASFKIWVVAQG